MSRPWSPQILLIVDGESRSVEIRISAAKLDAVCSLLAGKSDSEIVNELLQRFSVATT